MILNEGEVKCDKCNGTGTVQYGCICNNCYGAGKVDWVTNAMGGRSILFREDAIPTSRAVKDYINAQNMTGGLEC